MQSYYFLLNFLLLAHTSLVNNVMPEIMAVHEGENVILNCSAEKGEIQWYKDGELLMNNSQTTIYTDIFENPNSNTSFLELYGVEGCNSGTYCCQIVNETGNFSVAKFDIQVDLGALSGLPPGQSKRFRRQQVAMFKFSQQSYTTTEDEMVVCVCLDFVNNVEKVTRDITFILEYHNIGNTKSDVNNTSFGLPKLMYTANDQQACANISIVNDTLVEGTEKFSIHVFTNQTHVTIDEDRATADIYIMDSDFAEFKFLKDTYNVKEDSGIVNVCLELVDGTIEGVIIGLLVNTSLSNITNEDLVICDNQTMQRQQICFDIAVIDDHVVESAETAVICGCSPYDVTFNGCITLTIEDNEVVFQFSNSSHFNISEDSGTVIICLDRVNGASTEEVIIKVNLIVNDTAATFGKDFTGQSNLIFAAGMAQMCLSYSIIDDNMKEESEKFTVCVSSENPSVIFQGTNCTIAYITNNDRTLGEKLKDIATNLTSGMVENILSEISQFVQESEGNTVDQADLNLNIIFEALSNVSDFMLKKQEPITETVVANMTQTLNALLQWVPAAFESHNTSSRIVEIFEDLVSQYARQIRENEPPQVFNFTSLTIATERSSKSNLASSGRRFSNGDGVVEPRQGDSTALYPNENAAITLPSSLFEQVNDSTISIFLGFYETAALFPINITHSSSTTRQTLVTSPVIAATVIPSLEDLLRATENITITFRLPNNTNMFMASGSVQCVYWDFNSAMWLREGCTPNTSNIQNQVVSCHCNHLTNFAITAEVCTVERDCLNTTEKLEALNNAFTNLTVDNYEIAVFNLSQIVKESESMLKEQNGEVLGNIANYFSLLKDFLNGSNGSNIDISIDVVSNTTQVISSLLQWQPSNINSASSVAKTSRILQSFELVLSRFAQQLEPNESETIILPSITVALESVSIETLRMNGRSFVIGDISEPMLGSDIQLQPKEISQEQDGIKLPPPLFNNEALISKYNANDSIGLFFTLYNNSTLFPVNGGNNLSSDRLETVVGSRIIAATVGGLELCNLEEQERVTIVLQLLNPEQNYSKVECVYWDFDDNNWTSEGCTTATNESQSGTVTCSCNHLTNFAVVVDICLRQESCEISDDNYESLTIISYVGISISIICLLVTIISLLTFKIVRRNDISKYHIQLSLALLFMLTAALVLVAFSSARKVPIYGGCVTISILVHYFTLVAMMWMGAEALLMFQKLVTVFYQITTKYIVAISIVCWTIPLIPVVIPLIVDTAMGHDIEGDIIVMRNNSEEKIPYCFLSHPGAFFGAFLVPILAVMVFNTFIFIWVIVVLVRHSRNKSALQKKDITIKSILRRMVSISGIMSLFGLTWLFAVFTFLPINELKKMFDSFFVIFNSFQGLFIFFFYIVLNKDLRESWKELLLCGRYQSKHLHHSQPRTTPKLRNSGSSGSTFPAGVKNATEPSKPDLDTMTNKTAESESDVIKIPPPSLEAIELDKLSIKTAMSIEATVTMDKTNEIREPHETVTSIKVTVTMEETNETKESHETATSIKAPVTMEETKESHEEIPVSDKSKHEDEDMLSKMRIKQCATRREFKYQVEQVKVDFYDDDSDKEESTNKYDNCFRSSIM